MTIVGLVLQNHGGTIIFQHVREYLSHEKAHVASKAFHSQISSYDDTFITRGASNHLTGSIVVLNMYRVYYVILNELFILAISHANDNPYEGSIYLARAKRVLLTATKDQTEISVQRKYNEIYFAFERILFGEEGLDLLSQRISDIQVHYINDRMIDYDGDSVSLSQGVVGASSTVGMAPLVNSNSNSSGSNGSGSSGSSLVGGYGGVSSGGKVMEYGMASNKGSIAPTLSHFSTLSQEQRHFEQLSNKMEGLVLDKVFSVSDQLPKVDKHIYDPPAQAKWGNTTAQPTYANRVSNRIMFTLRHPNASLQSNSTSNSPMQLSSSSSSVSSSQLLTADDDSLGSLTPSPLLLSSENSPLNGSSDNIDMVSDKLPETTNRKYSISIVTDKKFIENKQQQSPAFKSTSPSSSSINSPTTSPISSSTSTSSSSLINNNGAGNNTNNTNNNQQSNTRDHQNSVSIPISKSKINFLSF